MGVFSCNDKGWHINFISISKYREIEKRKQRGGRPNLIRDRTLVETARCFIKLNIIVQELRQLIRRSVWHRIARSRSSLFCIRPTNGIKRAFHFQTHFGRVAIKVAFAENTRHIIHYHRRHSLYTGVDGRSVKCETAPTADADNANPLSIHKGQQPQAIHRSREILGINVGRCHITRLSTAFARIRRVKSQGYKAPLGHRLSVKSRCLLFYSPKSTTHGKGGKLIVFAVFREIQIANKGDTITISERNLFIFYLIALRKYLIPTIIALRHFHVCIHTANILVLHLFIFNCNARYFSLFALAISLLPDRAVAE